ncbi:NAD(P)H-binding protein [Alteromonas genovensis]|uniref:NAD(P)H-binding protein n=1 Tax=Alteromonas genovensis TaxID=471225 RepID=A0A6N9THJ2_9ALTE|nr:NAD(P)H-binding protein [Alteromonas genovensis]NDW16784.1 NAD(P)H-binding protein [Alteromonas genovensis]
MQKKIVITGYGWMAGYLGNALLSSDSPIDAHVVGTTRSDDKLVQMSKQNITGIKFALGDDTSRLCQYMQDATFIINIPPGRRSTQLDGFTQQVIALINDAVAANVAHIIFVSTTSVYGDSTNETLTETSAPAPETASAKAHVAIEEHLASLSSKVNYTVLRLAGLVGPDRHPARSLSGRELPAGNKRINLVHIADVVKGLLAVIETPQRNCTLHLCSALHPKRGEYYSRAASALNLPLPLFSDTESEAMGKVIDASASWQALDITPAYANPDDMY